MVREQQPRRLHQRLRLRLRLHPHLRLHPYLVTVAAMLWMQMQMLASGQLLLLPSAAGLVAQLHEETLQPLPLLLYLLLHLRPVQLAQAMRQAPQQQLDAGRLHVHGPPE